MIYLFILSQKELPRFELKKSHMNTMKGKKNLDMNVTLKKNEKKNKEKKKT